MARKQQKSSVVPSADQRVLDAWKYEDVTCEACATKRGAVPVGDIKTELGCCYFCGFVEDCTPVRTWTWPQIDKEKKK